MKWILLRNIAGQFSVQYFEFIINCRESSGLQYLHRKESAKVYEIRNSLQKILKKFSEKIKKFLQKKQKNI